MRFVKIAYDFVIENPWLTAANLVLAMALTPVHDVLLPHLYGKLLSTIEKGDSFKQPVAVVLVTITFVQLCSFVKDCLDIETQPRLFDFVRTRMMKALLDKYDGELLEPPTGLVVSTLTRSPEIIAAWVECIVDVCVPYVFAFVAAAVYFYIYDKLLALTLLILLTSLIMVLIYAPIRCINESIAREKALQQCHEQIDDTLRNVVSVYSTDSAEDELSRLMDHGVAFQNAHRTAMRCMLLYKGIAVPMVVTFFSLVIIRCCYLVERGDITKGTFVSLFMVTTSLVNTLAWMVSLVKATTMDTGTLAESQMMCSKTTTTNGEVLEVGSEVESEVESEEESEGMDGEVTSVPERDGIGFLHVTYTQAGSAKPVIEDLTYHFEGGERTLITGVVGSGKSTLLRLMMGFVIPDSGEMYCTGSLYRDTGIMAVRKQVAFMPQDAVLFDRTISENILYGNSGKTDADVMGMMDLMGVLPEFESMPHGIHTKCKKAGSGLSGGQKQLVFFMRVMLRSPDLIILDEPTASMDSRTKTLLMQALRTLSVDKTVIMISHDSEIVDFATRRMTWPPGGR